MEHMVKSFALSMGACSGVANLGECLPEQECEQAGLLQDDVGAATSFVEGEVRRLLAGNCETWEMVMTVSLW